MSNCRCHNPPFHYQDFVSVPVGIDKTHGRFGEVSVETCAHCGEKWLRYFVEYEAFTASGRWFQGVLAEKDAPTITPENSIAYLESLPWYFAGGSYFGSTGFKTMGKIRADL